MCQTAIRKKEEYLITIKETSNIVFKACLAVRLHIGTSRSFWPPKMIFIESSLSQFLLF